MVPAEYVSLATALADTAGAVIRPLFRVVPAAEDKADDSPVTVADRGAERAMRALLQERMPGHGIIGEEYGSTNADAEWVWVLDPVDGTRAFITGRPIFGTLIGLLHHGRPVLGVIDQPITGERWIGVAGEPTRFISSFGGQALVRACPRLDLAELSCTSPEIFTTDAERQTLSRVQKAVRRTTWGGDCYGYGLLALGQVDIIVEPGLKIWDWAALVPVITGAGGHMVDWQGGALTPQSDGRVLAVGDAALLEPALALLADR